MSYEEPEWTRGAPQHRRTKSDGPGEDYIEVRERLQLFYAAYPTGSVVTVKAKLEKGSDDKDRVTVKALAYRTPDDPHPGVGHSWMVVPGKTPYTNGSELENAETSAWGRAIAAVGIAIDRSIASAQEVLSKRQDEPAPTLRDKVIAEASGSPTEPRSDPETPEAAPEPVPLPDPARTALSLTEFKRIMRDHGILSAPVSKKASEMFPNASNVAELSDQERGDLMQALVALPQA